MESEKVKEIKKVLECIVNANGSKIEINYYGDLHADILTLINELEKENETKTDTITDLLKKQEFYEKEKLKQFAERLKEKIKAIADYYNDDVFDYSYNGIREKDIDETLLEAKLFIKKYFPENTRLEKALKEYYNNNKAIYDTHGYYFPKE